MPENLILVIGGARSGKSSFAVDLAKRTRKPVAYIATAMPCDREMTKKIEKHQKARPSEWSTLEVDKDMLETLKTLPQNYDFVIIDCWSFYISNLLGALGFDDLPDTTFGISLYEEAEEAVNRETKAVIEEIESSNKQVIIVTNEVGMGLVPSYPLGRAFRDLLGLSHQMLAQQAASVYVMLAGLPLELRKPKL